MNRRTAEAGFTLIEVVLALAFGALIVSALGGVMNQVSTNRETTRQRLALVRDAQFALEQITAAIRGTRLVLVPSRDKPATSWREHLREETLPASPPESGSTKATAVLAATLSTAFDLNGDGIADADNDGDGRVDEDLPSDITNDADPGVHAIDDGGNGFVDESFFSDADDDERLFVSNEDPINGVDDDGDGNIDEDPSADMNGDGQPGVAGIDDDGDGSIDEGNPADDDEDGTENEDWLDPVVFYLSGDTLVRRQPVPWDTSGDSSVTGRDFVVSPIAENVTLLRFERIPTADGTDLIGTTLTLTDTGGNAVTLNTQTRIGSGQ